ncbi:MAG: carbohydrate kinase family protein [Candidatus Doudnabacteria bacterium]|nr:carbohydrate kinase family protein [Candidatus Doudnabacteria bacterium]
MSLRGVHRTTKQSQSSPGLLRYARNDRKPQIFVSGSIARDLIMDFPGRFADYIHPDKIHVLNVSFAVDNLKENLGGTAANICYNLALLGERPKIVSNLGSDQTELLSYFKKLGLDTRYIEISKSLRTAAAHIITDKDDNQITGFHAGAMNAHRAKMPNAKKGDWAVIAAENPKNMVRLAEHYQRNQVNYIFDPGQQITALAKSELRIAIRGARVLIGNDYEISLIMSSLRGRKAVAISSPPGLLPRLAAGRNDIVLVKTLGPKGSEILAVGRKIRIGVAKPRRVVDPTGAGDTYRAGFLKGLILGYNLKVCGQLGATVASFAVEEYGTQEHKFTWLDIVIRYNRNFKGAQSLRGVHLRTTKQSNSAFGIASHARNDEGAL